MSLTLERVNDTITYVIHPSVSYDVFSVGIVPWKDGLVLPAQVSVEIIDDDLPYRIEFMMRAERRRPREATRLNCTALAVTPLSEDGIVVATDLRAIKLSRYLAYAASAAALTVEDLGTGALSLEPAAAAEVKKADVTRRRSAITDDLLREVARVYLEGRPSGKPRIAVQDRFPDKSTPTVARWIAAAKAKGLITPDSKEEA